MRVLIKKSILYISLITNILVFSNNKMDLIVSSKNTKTLSISLTEINANEKVLIKNYTGKIIFSENIENDTHYHKSFNFDTLPLGLYLVENISDKHIRSQTLLVSKNRINLIPNTEKNYTCPVIKISSKDLSIKVKNLHNTSTHISIHNNEGVLLHETETFTDNLIEGNYDISNVKTNTKLKITTVIDGYQFIDYVRTL